MVSKEFKHLFSDFCKEVKMHNGVIDLYTGEEGKPVKTDDDVIMVSVHTGKSITDDNCVVSIDWTKDNRVGYHRTFDVNTYNEVLFTANAKTIKQARKLQMIATKYSIKFWKLENRK